MESWRRVRWGNVGRAAAVAGVCAVVIAWPLLAADDPTVPDATPRPLAGGRGPLGDRGRDARRLAVRNPRRRGGEARRHERSRRRAAARRERARGGGVARRSERAKRQPVAAHGDEGARRAPAPPAGDEPARAEPAPPARDEPARAEPAPPDPDPAAAEFGFESGGP